MRLRLSDIFDSDRDGPLTPSRRDLHAFAIYVAAAAVYVVIGIAWLDFLLTFVVAVAYLVVMAWLVPKALRQLG